MASPIRFDNPAGPGHFNWYDGSGDSNLALDITLPSIAQIGIGVGSSFMTQIVNVPTVTFLNGPARPEVGGYLDLFAIDFAAGTLLPTGAPFGDPLMCYVYYLGFGSEIAAGVQTYLSVRFDPGDGFHYGWVGVVRTGATLDAFAWGYETEAGVAIAAGAGIPAPGSLALLAIGALGGKRRRRRD